MARGIDLDRLSLQDLLALQEDIARTLVRRFQREVALVFTDVVGSTRYFERHGDAAGKALIQRSRDLFAECLDGTAGRVVDTAGDGVFTVFPDADEAARVLVAYQQRIARSNEALPEPQRLAVRSGLHWGPALVDGESVSGDAVNFAARVAGAAGGDDLFVSEAALARLSPELRVRCRRLPPVELKGVSGDVVLHSLMWLDPDRFPDAVHIRETGEVVELPMQGRIRFGRLDRYQGDVANEVVLHHPDPDKARAVSRWHFELVRTVDGYRLVQLSRVPVVVDGRAVHKGEVVPLEPTSRVEVAGVLTLEFRARRDDRHAVETRGPWDA